MDPTAGAQRGTGDMTPRFILVPSRIPAGVEVYTSDGYRATGIQDYLDFLAAQAVSPRRIRRVARVLSAAARWIETERPAGPHVLRQTWEGYLLIPCAGSHLTDVPRLLRQVEILNAWSRFQHWYDPTHWPYHAFPPTLEGRRRWVSQLVTQPGLQEG